MKKKEKKLYDTKKYRCSKGKHRNWHYQVVWWTCKNDITKEWESHNTVVECYGSATKNKFKAGGYCKPFMCFDTESELYYALQMMATDVMKYPPVKIPKDPWEEI